MATDWPGHGATNRNTHIPANCDCGPLFTKDNQPPWYYTCVPETTSPTAWWLWISGTKFLYPTSHESGCEYRYQFLDPDSLEFRELLMTISIPESEPDSIEIIMRATRVSVLQTSQYYNSISTGVIAGPRAPRPSIWFFDKAHWNHIVDEPFVNGPPPYHLTCQPEDCFHNWMWGELLPAGID